MDNLLLINDIEVKQTIPQGMWVENSSSAKDCSKIDFKIQKEPHTWLMCRMYMLGVDKYHSGVTEKLLSQMDLWLLLWLLTTLWAAQF